MASRKPRKRKALKVGKTLPGYVKITSKNPLRAPTATEVLGGSIVGRGAAARIAAAVRPALAAARGISARAALTEAAGATLGAAAGAGALAYLLTSYGLGARDRRKLDLQEQAFRASQAYRAYREKLAADQGRPLTAAQLKQTRNVYRAELQKLGLSTNDLKKIMGATIFDPGHPIASN